MLWAWRIKKASPQIHSSPDASRVRTTDSAQQNVCSFSLTKESKDINSRRYAIVSAVCWYPSILRAYGWRLRVTDSATRIKYQVNENLKRPQPTVRSTQAASHQMESRSIVATKGSRKKFLCYQQHRKHFSYCLAVCSYNLQSFSLVFSLRSKNTWSHNGRRKIWTLEQILRGGKGKVGERIASNCIWNICNINWQLWRPTSSTVWPCYSEAVCQFHPFFFDCNHKSTAFFKAVTTACWSSSYVRLACWGTRSN